MSTPGERPSTRGRSVTSSRQTAEAERLVGLGATVLPRVEPEPPLVNGDLVPADPEGDDFCPD